MKTPQALALPLDVSQRGPRRLHVLSQSHPHCILKTASIVKEENISWALWT